VTKLNEEKEILKRLSEVETRISELELRVYEHDTDLSDLRGDLKEVRKAVSSLKEDIIKIIADQTDRTWKLIFALVAIVAILAGATQAIKLLV